MLAVRVARIIAKQKEYICLLRKCFSNIRKIHKNDGTLAGRVARTIVKHKENIGLLRKYYPDMK